MVNKIAPVFLSASIPDPKRNPKYFTTMDAIAIREAVCALTLVVAPDTALVFGGHPAISPFIYLAAQRLNALQNIFIYQSEFFRSVVPKESIAFSKLTWTSLGRDRDDSLRIMREKMIRSQTFGAAVFIGGMEGIEEECQMFQKIHPSAMVLPIASTGAAARLLFDQHVGPTDVKIRHQLKNEFIYGALFRQLLPVRP